MFRNSIMGKVTRTHAHRETGSKMRGIRCCDFLVRNWIEFYVMLFFSEECIARSCQAGRQAFFSSLLLRNMSSNSIEFNTKRQILLLLLFNTHLASSFLLSTVSLFLPFRMYGLTFNWIIGPYSLICPSLRWYKFYSDIVWNNFIGISRFVRGIEVFFTAATKTPNTPSPGYVTTVMESWNVGTSEKKIYTTYSSKWL